MAKVKNREAGEGQIIPKGENKWLIRWPGPKDQKTGRRKSPSKVVHGTRAQAAQELRKVTTSIDTGTYVAPTKLSVQEWCAQWLRGKAKISAKTRMDYTQLLTAYVYPNIGHYKLDRLTRVVIQDLVTTLQARGLSRRTIQYTLTTLSSALRMAVLDGLLAKNPREGVELPTETHEEPEVLTAAEIRQHMAYPCKRRLLWDLVFVSGLRMQEAVALEWKDVNWLDGTLSIRRAMKKVSKTRWELGSLKNPQSRRTIEVPQDFLEALKAHKTLQATEILRKGVAYARNDIIFAGDFGAHLDLPALRRAWYRDTKKAGIQKKVLMHKARHSHGTLLVQANVNPKVAADRLGNSVEVFMKTYAHVLKGMGSVASDETAALLYRKAQ